MKQDYKVSFDFIANEENLHVVDEFLVFVLAVAAEANNFEFKNLKVSKVKNTIKKKSKKLLRIKCSPMV